ncbi:enkurin [Echinops telfairi]|uniref:Enkurin n=1 Tax=Echinops telfairi TaxID=9371 RepID=A0ABM0J6R8_ECHTE|nr:enkurin [Echinops telfairi]
MDPTCFSESIYNLIPSDTKEPPQPPRYTSIFKTSVKDDVQKVKAAMKTMGPAKVELPSPTDFLKKRSKEKSLPPKKKFEWNEPRKPPVPLRGEHPVMGIQSSKNFINTNAADVIMGVAKKPKPIYVDKRTGDKHDLDSSGLVPQFINKKDYGATPEYICKRNQEVKKAQEEYDNYVQENLRKAAMKRLSDEEREAVLQGLKQNWGKVHREFQSLSVFIDSIPKKIRKQKLEEEMKQLEHDIGIIEKHKIIYIANK